MNVRRMYRNNIIRDICGCVTSKCQFIANSNCCIQSDNIRIFLASCSSPKEKVQEFSFARMKQIVPTKKKNNLSVHTTSDYLNTLNV